MWLVVSVSIAPTALTVYQNVVLHELRKAPATVFMSIAILVRIVYLVYA
jgi:hypothetical protein